MELVSLDYKVQLKKPQAYVDPIIGNSQKSTLTLKIFLEKKIVSIIKISFAIFQLNNLF